MRATVGLFLTAALAGLGQTEIARIAGTIINSEDGGILAGAAVEVKDVETGLGQDSTPPKNFWTGPIISIESDPEHHLYGYTVWNGVDDAYTGLSPTPLRVHLREEVKCAVVEPHFVYIVDDDGQVQKTFYTSQAEVTPVKTLPGEQ